MSLKARKLYPSKLKTILYLLVCSAFTTIGIFMLLEGDEEFMGWLGVCFFGLGVLVFFISLFPSANYLKLDENGFEVCNLYRKTRYNWQDIHSFSAGSIHMNAMVFYDFSPNFKKQRTLRKINTKIAGSQAALPNTYGLKAEALADLMNDYKEKYTTL